jgi:uncharacterized protein with LGFP repeats
MQKTAKRTAACAATAAIGIAAFAAGCDNSSKDSAHEAMSSASSVASSAASVASSAVESATSAMPSDLPAPLPTKIAGKDGVEYTVEGVLLEKYYGLDAKSKEALGAPLGEQKKNDDGGVYQQFDGGVIVSSPAGTHVVWGKIRDKWNELGGSQGKLGYPTSDETTNAEGQKQTTFQHGTLTWTEGADQAVVAGG